MLFVPLGDTDDIGASCHYLKVGDTGIVLDVGLHPEADGPAGLPQFDLLQNRPDWHVDHALITHAHHDHMGSLPVFMQRMPHAQIHMTRPTQFLLDMLLPASARLQKRKMLEGSSLHAPLFTKEQAEALSFIYQAWDLDTPFELPGRNGHLPVEATFYHAGHVLGAAGVLLKFQENGKERTCFYTSDTNLRPQTIHPGGQYPEGPVDVLLLESTLGADPDAELISRRTQEKALGEAIERVLARGGSVLLPVFALGRAQEIVALIDRFKQNGVIPEDTPVYTTGSMRGIADVYDRTRHLSPRIDPKFEVYGVSQKRLPRNQARIGEVLETSAIHVAASGMMFERTLSNRMAHRIIEDPKHGVFFVGFMKEDSPGYRLLEARQKGEGTEVTLAPMYGPQQVRCDVDRFRLSGHSHRRDLIQLVELMKPRKIALIHGEPPAREWMADNIRFFYPDIEIIQPEQGQAVEL